MWSSMGNKCVQVRQWRVDRVPCRGMHRGVSAEGEDCRELEGDLLEDGVELPENGGPAAVLDEDAMALEADFCLGP